MSSQPTIAELAKMIDHSLLHPTMTDAIIKEGCELAIKYQVATCCVKPYSNRMVTELLKGSGVGVCSVIGFPHGNSTTTMKVKETEEAIADGATEIDMVANCGKVLGGDWGFVTADIKAVNDACVANNAILKVIFENDFLENEHIIKLCEICSELEVAFVKTSSGYGMVKQPNGFYSYKGATMEHLKLMREHCPPSVEIKAAGGVRTLDDFLAVREIGVSRVGASATDKILEEARQRGLPES